MSFHIMHNLDVRFKNVSYPTVKKGEVVKVVFKLSLPNHPPSLSLIINNFILGNEDQYSSFILY